MEKMMVVKCGSNVVTANGGVSTDVLRLIAKQVSAARRQGHDVTIVSSGAVACGKTLVSDYNGSKKHLRRAAAIGQPLLMHHWSEAFTPEGITVGQYLGTHASFQLPQVIEQITADIKEIVPIINENDVVSVEELKALPCHGDNDMLAAIVSVAMGVDSLFLLTDVDGLYLSYEDYQRGKVIDYIYEISDEILGLANVLHSDRPTGMRAKLLAAKYAMERKVDVWIANGFQEVIGAVLSGNLAGTHCVASR